MSYSTRAAVLFEPGGDLKIEELKIADLGPNEALIRIFASGICHSDLNGKNEPGDLTPVVLGHEGAGIVEEVGKSVLDLKPGDHVVLSWLPVCNDCYYCAAGQHELCQLGTAGLWNGTLIDGSIKFSMGSSPVYHYSLLSTFSDRIAVDSRCCIKIPETTPFPIAALVGCAVTTGMGAVRNAAKVQPEETVIIFGAGGVGLSAVMAAKLAQARETVVVDPVAQRRQTAAEAGATVVIDPRTDDLAEIVLAMTEGRGADVVIEASGVEGMLGRGFDLARKGARIVSVGVPPSGSNVILPGPAMTRSEISVVGSFYGSSNPPKDMPRIIGEYQAGILPLDLMVSKTFKLDEINEGFAAMIDGTVARSVLELES